MPATSPDPELSDSKGSKPQSVLNEPQHRHFEVFLAMLEDALIEIESLTYSSLGSGRLTVYDADLPPEFGVSAQPLLDSIREEMTRLADSLGISQQHRSTKRTVSAILTAELVRLDDSYAAKLRGYGAVNPQAITQIDPILEEVRSSLTSLMALLDVTITGIRKRDSRP